MYVNIYRGGQKEVYTIVQMEIIQIKNTAIN